MHFELGLLRHVCVYECMHAHGHAQDTYTHTCACLHTRAHVDIYGHSHIHTCALARIFSMYVRVFFFLRNPISIKKRPDVLSPKSSKRCRGQPAIVPGYSQGLLCANEGVYLQ